MKKSKLLGVFGIVLSIILFSTKVSAAVYKEYTIGQEIKFNPINGEYCTSGDNCKTFNVINVGKNSSYYEVMLNYNLIPTSTWGDAINGPTVAISQLKEATKNWKGIEAYYDSIKLPSSSGTYTINYNGSKARMITAEEVAAIYNYKTIGGSKWVWNGQSPSNNIEFLDSNSWLAQNLNQTGYGDVYDDIATEDGHFPFDYYTASVTNQDDYVYAVTSSTVVMENVELNYDYGNFDCGLRPVIRLKKEVDNEVIDTSLVNPIVISGVEVVPGNKIPTIDELSINCGLKITNLQWVIKKDKIYQDVIVDGLDTFEKGNSYMLLIDFDGNLVENYRYYLPINDYVYKYNNVESYLVSSYNDNYTQVLFLFDNIKEKSDEETDIITTKVTKKEDENPKTYDNGIVTIIVLAGSMLAFVFGTKRLIKKGR